MTAAAYAVATLVLAGCAAWAASVLRKDADGSQPPHDRVPLTWRERAAWRTFTRRFSRDLRRQLAVAWVEEHIARAEERMRRHLSESGDA